MEPEKLNHQTVEWMSEWIDDLMDQLETVDGILVEDDSRTRKLAHEWDRSMREPWRAQRGKRAGIELRRFHTDAREPLHEAMQLLKTVKHLVDMSKETTDNE